MPCVHFAGSAFECGLVICDRIWLSEDVNYLGAVTLIIEAQEGSMRTVGMKGGALIDAVIRLDQKSQVQQVCEGS